MVRSVSVPPRISREACNANMLVLKLPASARWPLALEWIMLAHPCVINVHGPAVRMSPSIGDDAGSPTTETVIELES